VVRLFYQLLSANSRVDSEDSAGLCVDTPLFKIISARRSSVRFVIAMLCNADNVFGVALSKSSGRSLTSHCLRPMSINQVSYRMTEANQSLLFREGTFRNKVLMTVAAFRKVDPASHSQDQIRRSSRSSSALRKRRHGGCGPTPIVNAKRFSAKVIAPQHIRCCRWPQFRPLNPIFESRFPPIPRPPSSGGPLLFHRLHHMPLSRLQSAHAPDLPHTKCRGPTPKPPNTPIPRRSNQRRHKSTARPSGHPGHSSSTAFAIAGQSGTIRGRDLPVFAFISRNFQ